MRRITIIAIFMTIFAFNAYGETYGFSEYARKITSDFEEPTVIRGRKTDISEKREWYKAYIKNALNEKGVTMLVDYENYSSLAAYWGQYIPEKYVYILLNEALIHYFDMRYVYTVSRIETCNYTAFVSKVKNKNGTWDAGLMGLNSANADENTDNGKHFLHIMYYRGKHNPEPFDYKNEKHVVSSCVKYLKNLHHITGTFGGAVKAYNCGLKRATSKKLPLPKITTEYAKAATIISERHKNSQPDVSYTIYTESYTMMKTLVDFGFIEYPEYAAIKILADSTMFVPDDIFAIKHILDDRHIHVFIKIKTSALDFGPVLAVFNKEKNYWEV